MAFENYLSAFFIIGIIVAIYGLYYILAYSKVYDCIYAKFGTDINPTVFHSVFFRLTGFFLFGILTSLICIGYGAKFDYLTLETQYLPDVILWSVSLAIFLIIVAYINVKNSKKSHYPQFKIKKWTVFYKFATYFTWILYISAYEFMFRGVLLFGTVEAMGYYPAIILNVFLYAFGHIPKGWKEVLGCILLGPVLCVLALKTQNIAIPILVHLALCLSNEFFSIRAEELAQKKSSAQL